MAAKLDTSQGEIVALGIELLENSLKKSKPSTEHPAREMMREAIENNNSLEWRREIREKLEAPGISIDKIRIASWSEIDED